MAFSDERFRSQLIKLEAEARDHPRRHAVRLFGVLALGYAVPLGILVLCGISLAAFFHYVPPLFSRWHGGAVFTIFVGTAVILGVAVAVFLRFFKKPATPTGKTITRQDAPAFWELLDELKTPFPAVRIERVFVEGEITAGVMTQRRFGVFGKSTGYMFVGLGMLACTSREQLRSVLSHEFAHLQLRHTSLAAWMAHMFDLLHGMVKPLLQDEEKPSGIGRLFVRYFEYFGRQTVPIRRRHEFEADRLAADVTDERTTATALYAISLQAFRSNRVFWSDIFRQVADAALPPNHVATELRKFLAESPDPQIVQNWLAMEQASESPIVDYHPSLKARLAALGCGKLLLDSTVDVGVPPTQPTTGLLGDALEDLEAYVSAQWKGGIIGAWREQHAGVEFQRKRAAEPAAIDADEAQWRKIELEAQYGPVEQAQTTLQGFLETHPDHAQANYTLGTLLMERHDPAGQRYLDYAVELDRSFSMSALGQQLYVYQSMGRDRDADAIKQRIEQFEKSSKQSDKLRTQLTVDDELIPHDLTPSHIERLNHALMLTPQVEALFVAKKKMREAGDQPSLVFGVGYRRRTPRRGLLSMAQAEELLRSFVNGPCAVVAIDRVPSSIKKKLHAVCPAPVFHVSKRR